MTRKNTDGYENRHRTDKIRSRKTTDLLEKQQVAVKNMEI